MPESGGTWLLPRIVGWSKAAELLFTARTLTAPEALDLGLVSQVVPNDAVLDAAFALAQEVAANAPLAIRASKRLMRHAMTEGLEDHVQRQYLALLPLFGTKDFREGLASLPGKAPSRLPRRIAPAPATLSGSETLLPCSKAIGPARRGRAKSCATCPPRQVSCSSYLCQHFHGDATASYQHRLQAREATGAIAESS